VILIEELTEEGSSKVMPFSKADDKKKD